jgi:hypothetical protein
MKKNQKYMDSPIARFHKNLAAARNWNIDQLAEAMQLSALEAQKATEGENAQRATDGYVKDMLYGRRPMPHRWRIATATVLEIPFADYEQQLSAATHGSAPTTNEAGTLPIDFWPHFEWRSRFTSPRKIAARLYGLSKAGISPSFTVVPGQWQPPAGFAGFANLRKEAWQELVENYSRMKKEPPNPKMAWHVRRIIQANGSSVALEIMKCDYRDILVTATQQGLEHAIQTLTGQKCTVRQWLASSWRPGDYSEPVLPGSRQIVVDLMVVTKEGSVVLSRQGPDSPESAGSWATSVSTVINPKTDCDSSEKPDLARAASRGCKEELNMETDGVSVRWLTMAAGLKYGSHTFFGMLESGWSKQEIQRAVARNVEQAARDRTHVCQVVEVDFLELSPKSVGQRLRGHDYRPYLELGLALLLWRNRDATILEGVQETFTRESSK